MRVTGKGRLLLAAVAVAGLIAAGAAPSPSAGERADLVLTGGAVYTVDAPRSWAEAVAVRGGRITYVGTAAGAKRWIGPSTRVIDLAGKMVLPGFHDAHVHPVEGGMDLALCNLTGLKTKEAVFEAIRKYAAEHPEAKAPWILGSGWDLPLFPDASPTRAELDALVPDRPAEIGSADGHSSWVNSKALAIAGVTRETPDPPEGRIERDSSGEPSGTLRESAKRLVSRHVPESTPAEYAEGLRRGIEMANRLGITSLIEANAGDRILAAYADAERGGRLTARVLASLSVSTRRGPEQVTDLERKRQAATHGRLRATAAKIFADGVIESETAAMLSPYLDKPGWSGVPNLEPEAFDRLATALDAKGFQIHIHAIGDRAVRMSLDALEAARKANGPRDARPLIAHLEVIEPEDIPRFRRIGVVADFQPLWAFADPYIKDLTLPKLGPERSRWIYPIGSVAASGAVVAGGSDWSVSSMNPLEAIEVAVRRQDPDAPAGEPFLPEERIALPQAIAAYTIAGAYAAFEEKETGSIETGKAADLIVLDRNLFEIPAEQIGDAKVLLTLLEGKTVYRDPSFAP
ncbi:MAG TPA: amidohydrolase [Thermoanaerobaculia bacterium]